MKKIIINFSNIKNTKDTRLSPWYFIITKKYSIPECIPISKLIEKNSDISSGLYVSEYKKTGKKYIRVKDVKKYSLNYSEIKFVENAPKRAILQEFEIFYPRMQNVDKMGQFCLSTDNLTGSVVSQNIGKILLKNNINAKYVCAYLNSKFGKEQMFLASSADGRSDLTNYQASQIKIFFFEDIKEKISKNVETIININKKNREILEVVNQKISIFMKDWISTKYEKNKISKDLLIQNDIWIPSCYKDHDVQILNFIKDSTKYEKLSNLLKSISKGIEPGSNNYVIDMKKNNEKPFIRTSDIYNNEIDMYPDYFVENNMKVKKDWIIFSKDGKIGQTSIVNEENIVIGSGFAILEFGNKLPVNYIYAIMQNNLIIPPQARMKTVTGATIPHLKNDRIKDFLIPIMDEIKINEIDKLISKWRKNIELKNNLIWENDLYFLQKYNSIFKEN